MIAITANVLGSFNDPFEFEGDYGPEVNPVRRKVFELVVSNEVFYKNYPDAQIQNLLVDGADIKAFRQTLLAAATRDECTHGPTLAEVAESMGGEFQGFIDKYADKKIFRLMRNEPAGFLSFDKILRDKAAHSGAPFDLPILSSTTPLKPGSKKELMEKLFTEENLKLAKPQAALLPSLDEYRLSDYFGPDAETDDLRIFTTPAGQLFFYWLYQALNLHLVSNLMEEVNKVKEVFAKTLGDPKVRAEAFKEKLIKAECGVVFTQESDAFVPRALADRFHPVEKQNPQDGTFIFLRKDLWEPDYEVIKLNGYEGFEKGRINIILAKAKQNGEKFLLASAHGNSTKPEDGRLQINLAFQKYQELSHTTPLQLLIGIDANTKTKNDVKTLRDQLEFLGLTATSVGPTTVKQRMVTVQHTKAGRFAVDEEDYLITLKSNAFASQTVGFSEIKPETDKPLPHIGNLSDHYPVGATLKTNS